MFNIRLNITVNRVGLQKARNIMVSELATTLKDLGKALLGSYRTRAREQSGQQKKRTYYKVSGTGLNKTLDVFGSLVQHFIDELGLPAGTFPPWDVGSRIYKYVQRKGLDKRRDPTTFHRAGKRRRARKVLHVRQSAFARRTTGRQRGGERVAAQLTEAQRTRQRRRANRIRRVAFLVARAIYERGIKANRAFGRTFEAERQRIIRDVNGAFERAVQRINRGS